MINQQEFYVQPIEAILLSADKFYYKRVAGWIDETGVAIVRFWYKLEETATECVRCEEGYKNIPAAAVEPLIDSYDPVTGDVVIKTHLVPLFLQQFNLQLREETPEPDA